jgi:hypothetical protein
MKKALALALGVLLLGAAAVAEAGRSDPLFVPNSSLGITGPSPSSKFRLIDPSRLTNSNEVIFSYGSSGKNNYQGLYLSTFGYQLASPLDMSVTLGASLTPSGVWGDSSQGRFFLSSVNLRYQPSESTLFEFHYQDPRGMLPYYYANPLANRWWYKNR